MFHLQIHFFILTVVFRPKSCSDLKRVYPNTKSGPCTIYPDGEGGLQPYNVTCNMTDKNEIGVTVVSHDSESRTLVNGYEGKGFYSRDIHYQGATVSQLVGLINVSKRCEQFIKYECLASTLHDGFWVSRDSVEMNYWGGATPDPDSPMKCACGMNNTCAIKDTVCNCVTNEKNWLEDSGLLTEKTHLPVKQLRFGDTGNNDEQGYHTLGKFKCYGIA